jgi:hypothetical protein
LTALSRDIPGYGAIAARQLLSVITGSAAESIQDEAPHLVTRGSTAAPLPRPAAAKTPSAKTPARKRSAASPRAAG